MDKDIKIIENKIKDKIINDNLINKSIDINNLNNNMQIYYPSPGDEALFIVTSKI